MRIVLVTGGSHGIGKAIATEFAKDTVIVNYNNSEKEAVELVEELRKSNKDSMAIKADVSVLSEVENMVEIIAAKFGRIDVLVNNAGVLMDKTLKKMTEEEWDTVLGVNLKGCFNCCKAVLPFMKTGGRVVNISSVLGLVGNAGQTNYCASKAGVIGFTKALAKEVGKKGITANVVCPGLIDTKMVSALPFIKKRIWMSMIPVGRLGKPSEVASVVKFLASESASYVNGSVVNVDGGLV